MGAYLVELKGLLIDLLPRLVLAAGVFAALWAGAAVAGRLTRRAAGAAADRDRAQAIELLGQALRLALLLLGAVSALGTVGVNVSALVAGLGLTGFALGFALKDALSNLLSGILIVLYRPFHRGDHIQVAGFEGRVADIDLRYTTLEGEERRVLIPNSLLFTNTVVILQQETHAA